MIMSAKSIRGWYWITTILLAAFMVFSGISHLMGGDAVNELMGALGYPLYLNAILGVAKILGSIAIIQNRFTAIKEWAYAGFAIDLVGAIISFFAVGMASGAWGVVPFLVVMAASYALWKKLQ